MAPSTLNKCKHLWYDLTTEAFYAILWTEEHTIAASTKTNEGGLFMKPRCKRLSLLLTLCILLFVFTAFPTVSAVSVQPPADAAAQPPSPTRTCWPGLRTLTTISARWTRTACRRLSAMKRRSNACTSSACIILKPNKTVDKNLHIIHICKIMLGFCTVLIGF